MRDGVPICGQSRRAKFYFTGASPSIVGTKGPCLQSVVITLVDKFHAAIDVFYRSVEWFKKFPADIVFIRDVLLKPFDFSFISERMRLTVTFHFANITVHPQYWAVILPHIDDPIGEMGRIREHDGMFHYLLVKHTRDYVCNGTAIANHAQSLRVQKFVLEAIRGPRLSELRDYLCGDF